MAAEVGSTYLRAAGADDGSKEGSVARWEFNHDVKSCLVLSPSWVLASGENVTDLRFLSLFLSKIGAGDDM